jgi:hypothetical protein
VEGIRIVSCVKKMFKKWQSKYANSESVKLDRSGSWENLIHDLDHD